MTEETQEVFVGCTSLSLGDVARDRYCCSSHLRNQTVGLFSWKSFCSAINIECQIKCLLPAFQVSKRTTHGDTPERREKHSAPRRLILVRGLNLFSGFPNLECPNRNPKPRA